MSFTALEMLYSEILIGEEEAFAVSDGPDFYTPPLNDRVYWATLEDVRQTQLACR